MSKPEAWQVTDDSAVLYEKSFVPAIFAPAAVTLADAAAIGRGDRVLDVACGTGVVAREATKRVGPEGLIVGLDLNPGMLAVARRLAPEIEWREGDAGDLSFEAGTFDVVLSQFALMFFPDRVRALGEMWRVLAPGGRLALAVCGPQAKTPGYALLTEVAQDVRTAEVVELLKSPFALGDRDHFAELLREAGIVAEIATVECPIRFPSIDALVHTEIKASPIRDVIDEKSFEALLAGARERLAPLRRGNGEVAFSMPTHIATARRA